MGRKFDRKILRRDRVNWISLSNFQVAHSKSDPGRDSFCYNTHATLPQNIK